MQLLTMQADESLRDFSLRTLRANIISLDMVPGQMYSEKELAAALGLSRTPMREALIDLSRMRIVTIWPQRGTQVALIDYDLIEEAHFMREALESAVAEQCAGGIQPRDLRLLEINLDQQRRFRDQSRYQELLQMDDAFHHLLFRAVNKPLSWELMQGMTIHFDRVRAMALSGVSDLGFVEEHAALLDAVREKDAPLAGQLMHRHLLRYRVDAAGLREKYPRYMK